MARMEIVTRRERRRSWSDEEKLRLVTEADASGLSVAEFARRNDLYPQQLYTWRREFRRLWAAKREPADSVTFLPVDFNAAAPTASESGEAAAGTIEIGLVNGRVLRVPVEIDADRLGGLIRVLEDA